MEINERLFIFESDPDFSDNSRGFWEYLNKNTDYITYWIIKDPIMLNILHDKHINCELFGTAEADKLINTAHYLVTSSFNFAYSKKKGQVHISLWHGFPLKLIGFFDSASADDDFINLKIITTQTDFLTVTSRLSHLTLSGLLSLDPRKVIETGYPRNDLLFNYDGKEQLSKILDMDLNSCKLFLYLPTMRKGLKDEGIGFEDNIFNYYDYDSKKLDEYLELNNSYIVAKLHFADIQHFHKTNFELPTRLILLNNNDLCYKLLTIYHIMNAFDALITDYSSVYVDYLLLDKPIIFSCPDLKTYKKDRGFVVDDPSLFMPGASVQNQKEFLNELSNIINGIDTYRNKRHETMPLFHKYLDNNSSKRILSEIESFQENYSNDINKMIGYYYFPNISPLSQYSTNNRLIKFESLFYFDTGNDFNEIEKMSYNISFFIGDILEYNIKLPNNIKKIRFDPFQNGNYIFEDFKIISNYKNLSYFVNNCIKINNTIILENDNPQIIIDNTSHFGSLLKITFKCKSSFLERKMINQIVFTELHDKNNKLFYLQNSLSWKITKPLRLIKRIIKR